MTLLEVLLESKEIKRLIVSRSQAFTIPLAYVCHHAGVEYEYFLKAYINSIDSSRAEITEEQMMKILETYGISLRFLFIVDEKYDHEGVKEMLKEKYSRKTKKDARKDKRNGASD